MAGYTKFTNLPIYKDIEKISKEAKNPTMFRYWGILHTPKKDIVTYRILSIDTIRNYINNISDEIHLLVSMSNRDYLRNIYPFSENIEFTLKIEEFYLSQYSEETIVNKYVERFKAILKSNDNTNSINADAEKYSDLELDLTGFIDVRFQLLNRVVEPLRIKLTNGVFHDVSPKDLMSVILYTESNKIKVDGKPILEGIDIVEPSNSELQKNIVIPTGTHVIDIPDLTQNEYCGVYSSGLGSYIQYFNNKYIWFIYPLYDFTRFETSTYKKIVFYNTDKQTLPASEKTYREEGDVLYIMITGQVKYYNDGENTYMDSGVGFKAPHAKPFMRKPVVLKADSVEGKRTELNHEAIVKDRPDGLNYAPRCNDYITSNPFKTYSDIAKKSVAQITLEWNHSRYDLIYPGMPCEYNFIANGEVKKLKGVILFTHTMISMVGNPSTITSYSTNTAITIAVEKSIKSLEGEQNYGTKD